MPCKVLCEYINEDQSKKAIVSVYTPTQFYYIDYYKNNSYNNSISYPGKSLRYVEDAAESYINGIFNNIKDY